MEKRGFAGCGRRVRFGALALRYEPRDPIKHDAQDALVRAGGRQVQADLGFHPTTRAAILMRRSRSVSNWATAKLECSGIAARRPHMRSYEEGG
jgi:hypothetical protein